MSHTVAPNLSPTPVRQRRAPGLRGFSLIELLVVISIIAVIMGMVLAVGVKMRDSAKESQTRITLGSLKAIADEYQVETKLKIPHLNSLGSPLVFTDVDWTKAKAKNAPGATGTGLVDDTIERFVWCAYQLPTTKKMLTGLGKTLFKDADGDGFLEVLDGWEQQLWYAALVAWDDNNNGNDNDNEGGLDADDFLPIHETPFFASMGVDRLWGNARSPTGAEDDNLYSYNLD